MTERRRTPDRRATPRDGCDRRKLGRPRAAEPLSQVCTWLPTSLHDHFAKQALREDRSLSDVLREFIVTAAK